MIVTLEVPGDPRGKGRHRVTRSGHAYTPDQTVLYENLIKTCYLQKEPQRADYTGPVRIVIYAFYRMPKASKVKTTRMVNGDIKPTKKPDMDNILKVVADALNGIAWKDDAQIVEVSIKKAFEVNPGLLVRIIYLEGTA